MRANDSTHRRRCKGPRGCDMLAHLISQPAWIIVTRHIPQSPSSYTIHSNHVLQAVYCYVFTQNSVYIMSCIFCMPAFPQARTSACVYGHGLDLLLFASFLHIYYWLLLQGCFYHLIRVHTTDCCVNTTVWAGSLCYLYKDPRTPP